MTKIVLGIISVADSQYTTLMKVESGAVNNC